MTIKEAKAFGKLILSNNNSVTRSSSIDLDVSVLLMHFISCDKTFLLLNLDYQLSKECEEKFRNAINLRNSGKPIAYITNKKEFFCIDFFVNEDVLIPKPDTEILVEKAIQLAKENEIENAIDVCTGSGCIAISIEKNAKIKNFFASDISEKALEVAKKNAKNILKEDDKINFFKSDLFSSIPENLKFDMIVSNPPYIPKEKVDLLLLDGRSEPRLALDGDKDGSSDGMAIIRPLVKQAFLRLNDKGFFLCETGEYNAKQTLECCQNAGFSVTSILEDLEGMPRVVFAIKN